MEHPERGCQHHKDAKKRGVAFTLFSACCILWVLIRSGRKPSRLAYPCQQAALMNSAWLIPAAGIGLTRLIRSKKLRLAVEIPLVLSLAVFAGIGFGGDSLTSARIETAAGIEQMRERAALLAPKTWAGEGADGAHDVFVVSNVPVPQGSATHDGVQGLLHLLAGGGVHLYKSNTADSFYAAPDGIIASNDVVLLKVNAAFSERGMTNTDVVRGMIAAILNHPDGFTGEVVIVENCEGGPDFNQQYNNAENVYQSFNAVVASFNDPGRVSTSSWWSIRDSLVEEYSTGDFRQGYVMLGNNIAYPKFSTGRGTCISLKHGIFDGSRYDKSRLKYINMPVLKSHKTTGITGCLKLFMGVPNLSRLPDVHNDLVYYGYMGRLMNEIIYPDLNIMDATWTSPHHPQGPDAPYSLGVRTNMLLGGVDPVAVDYYAAKYVVFPISGYGRHDPDTPYTEGTNPYHDGTQSIGFPYNALRVMLNATSNVLRQGGHDVSCDPAEIKVWARDLADGLGWSGGHCVTGVTQPATEWYFAEGTTRQGFEEWICIENPNDKPTEATVDFMTGEGDTISHKLQLGAHSRGTIHANSVAGEGKDISCKVSAGLPVVAERPMYFSYEGRLKGGHSVVGATAPAARWYFAEGYTGTGFDQWVCVLNPNDGPARLTFRFQTQEGEEKVRDGGEVPAHTRSTFKVNDLLGANMQNSLELESTLPVIAERPIYFDYLGTANLHWKGGHCVIGAIGLSKQYYFAEGTTRQGFEEWITIQNTNDSPLSVNASYQLGEGQGDTVNRSYSIGPGKRHTIYVANEVGGGKDVSTKLSSSLPFLAERPLYFRYSGYGAHWPDGHCVTGLPQAGSEFYFAEGYTGPNFQEWLCIQNPGDKDSTVEVRYYTEEAGALPPKTVNVPAGRRVTIRVNDDAGPNYQLSCRLEVKDGPPVVAERPIYFDYR